MSKQAEIFGTTQKSAKDIFAASTKTHFIPDKFTAFRKKPKGPALRITEKTCKTCGYEGTNLSITTRFCAGCHFAGWWWEETT